MDGAAFDYGYRMAIGAVVLGVGFGLFTWLIWVRLRLMLSGRPETRWDLVAARAKRLFQIGIGQRKMFKEPASGLLHAVTFWGFCMLFVRSNQLFAQAFFPEFQPLFGLQPAYDFAKDLTEVFVLVAIIGFFIRRLVVKPARIHYSGEALVILGFIGSLMITDFLYDGLHFGGRAALAALPTERADILHHVSAAPVASWLAHMFADSGLDPKTMQIVGEVNYWIHVAILVTFLNLLPISKHFHVITALPNVFLSNLEPTGALERIDNLEERLENGESLGIGKIEDLSWKQMLDLYTCTECGRCTVNCPAWNTDKPLNPAFIIKDMQANLYDEKDRLLAPTAVSGEVTAQEIMGLPPLIAVLNSDAIWACTTCRSCSEQCPVMIEHVDKIVGVRRHLMMTKNSFPEELVTTLTNLENKSNPWGIASSKRDEWARGRPEVPTLETNPNPEYLYFVGCAGAHDDRAQKVTEAIVTILNTAKVDFAIMGRKEKCSGDPARRMGNEYLFQESARENIETMKSFDIRKVIATCPHCFNTIKNEYPQLGGEFEVLHHTQLIRNLLDGGHLTLKKAAHLRITYHDSCYMGRYNNEYDAPREILAAVPGVEVVEMDRNKSMGMCCGAGGARMFMEEKLGSRVNHLRVEQAMETKPEVVAVNCPWCMTMMKDGLREKSIDNVIARDIAEIVADALVLPDFGTGKCDPIQKSAESATQAPPAEPAPPPATAPVRKKASKKKKKSAPQAAPAVTAETPQTSAPSDVAPPSEPDTQAAPQTGTVRKKATKKKKKAAPVRAAVVESAPVESAPVEIAPVEIAPVEIAPVESAPVESAPVEAAPVEAAEQPVASYARAPTRKKSSKKKKKKSPDATE